MSDNAQMFLDFMELVRNQGDAEAVEQFLADEYPIVSDHGYRWECATL